MEIPNTWAPLVVSAVRDGLLYNEGLLLSNQTIRNRADHEEHVMQLSQFLEYLKEQYRAVVAAAGREPRTYRAAGVPGSGSQAGWAETGWAGSYPLRLDGPKPWDWI